MERGAPLERDLPLTCQHCGRTFIWTVGDQRYYLKKRRPTPRYCRQCRLDDARGVETPSTPRDVRQRRR